MKKIWFLILLLPLLVACGVEPNEDLAAPPEVQDAIYGEEAETEQSVPDDEGEADKVAGKPRLVEFYADW